MEGFFGLDISEKRVLTVFSEEKVISLELCMDDDAIEEGVTIKVEGMYTNSGVDELWDNESWIMGDLIGHLFKGEDYPSVNDAFKACEFQVSDIQALKYLLIEGVNRGFFSNQTIESLN